MTASYVPRYRTIERSLRERVATLRPGDALPSDSELCAEFGVSRMTARSAMQLLADEGLIERVPGRGSFVAEPSTHRRADRLMSFSREMARQGRVPSSRIVTREIRPARSVDAAGLNVREGDPVVVLQRVRCADGVPVALETAVLERRVAPAVMAADVTNGSLHAALQAAGHVLRRGRATITAAAASAMDTRLLDTASGAPMLVERRVILDGDGQPLETTESRYPAERYALDVWFDVEEPSGG